VQTGASPKGKIMSRNKDRAAELAASMPDAQDELLAVAAAAVDALQVAVLAGDQDAADLARDRYNATIWKLNGGTFFACVADENAPGNVVDRHCQAEPGAVPKWGQSGAFLVAVDGIRALVEFGSGLGWLGAHFAFRVVDLDKPFITETGYRSHFDEMRAGQTVDEAATAILAGYLKEKRPALVAPSSRDRLALEPLPAWLTQATPPPCRLPAATPPGFVLVDVVLPAHRAFVARKWAAQARDRMEADQARQREQAQAEKAAREAGQRAAEAARLNAEDGGEQFCPGQRCEIISAHHQVFRQKQVGKFVIVTSVSRDTRQVWAHDDAEARYRINRNGRKVLDYDPKCVLSIYSFDQLRPDGRVTTND
jgi:hypothetical protein